MGKGKAKFKFNGGYGALLCSHCSKIVKEGKDFTEEEWEASIVTGKQIGRAHV